MARIALEKGTKHSDTSGALNRYLTALYMKYKTADNTRIYGQFVYLFYGENLITAFQLPNEFRATADKIAKRIAHERSTKTEPEKTEDQHEG